MKRTLSILLSVVMIVSAFSAMPFTAKAQLISGEADNVNYSFDTATGVMTISGSGAIMSNYNATNTPWNAYKKDIKKVVFENEITAIGENSFNGCTNLSEIVFSQNLVVISASAFVGCSSLKSVEMPDSVMTLNSSAFMNCSSLKTVKLSKNITGIDNFVFKNCTSLESISIPASVSRIGNMAFQGCTNLKNIDFDKSQYMTVEEYAFDECTSLFQGTIFYNGTYDDWKKYVIFSEGNTSFLNAQMQFLEEGECGENVSYVLNPKTGKVVISGKGAMYDQTPIYSTPFTSRKNIKTVVVEEGVTSIGDMAFFQTNVETVSLPSTLKRIGECAFYECTKLYNPIIPSSVDEIGQSAFLGCSAITSITLPGTLKSIKSATFNDCYSLASIDIPAGVTAIEAGAFSGCNMLGSVSLWYGVKTIGRSAFFGCTSLRDVYYYGTNAQFNQIQIDPANDAFENATRHFQTAVGQCGSNVYYSIENNSVTIYGSGDMYDYDDGNNKSPFFISQDIYSVDVQEGVTSVSPYAFYNCDNLTSVSFADSVEEIGTHAFDYCYRLTTLSFGAGISTIRKSAFMGCTKIDTINYAGSDEDWNKVAIFEENFGILSIKPQLIRGNCGPYASFTLSTETGLLTVSGTGTVYQYDLGMEHIRPYVKNIVIEEGLKTIHIYVFRNFVNLESVYLPDSLKEIYSTSFYDNNSDYTVSARCNNKAVKEAFKDTSHEIIKRHRLDKSYTTENKKDATCTEKGYYELNKRCMDCGVLVESHPYSVDALGHDYKTTVTKATFGKDGKTVKKCSRCGKKSTVTIAAVTASFKETKLTYTGKPNYPKYMIKDTNNTGLHMSDYDLKWPSKSTDIGNYVLTVTLKGNHYEGTKKLAYKICPEGTSIRSLKSTKSKQIRAVWGKQKTKTSGYEVQISTDSKFKNAVTTYRITKNTTVAKDIKGLKGGKKYYVRVRTYKNKNDTKFYSDWSKAKSITTKK